MVKNLLVVGNGQHFYVGRVCRCGIFDGPFSVFHPLVFYTVLHNHLQHDEDVLDGLDAQSAIEFIKHKGLHSWFTQFCHVAKVRQQMIFKRQHIGCEC